MNKKVLAMFLMCLLCVSVSVGVIGTKNVHASDESFALSHKYFAMCPEMTKQLKLSDVSSEVKWSTSDKKIVSILGTKGKNKQSVTIKSGKKAGTCTIETRVGTELHKFTVIVKSDSKVSRAKLIKVRKTKNKVVLKVRFINNTNHDLWYGNPYQVDKYVNGKWVKMAPGDDIAFTEEAYSIPSGSHANKEYTIATGKKVSDFTAGIYRLKVNASFSKNTYQFVYFEIK